MVFSRLVDLLPRVRRIVGSDYGVAVRQGLELAFPSMLLAEREEIVRGISRHRAFNRAIYRLHTRFPAAARVAARFIPITGARRLKELLREDRPIVIAGPHFGPIFFCVATILPMLRGRTVYVLHSRQTQHAADNDRYLRGLGVVPVFVGEQALTALARKLRDDPRSVAIVAFDHLGAGRRRVRFFDTTVTVSQGVAYLADVARASILAICWHVGPSGPRLNCEGPYFVDRTLPRRIRQARLIDELFAFLETRIRKAPQQWTEWHFVASASHAVVEPGLETPALLDREAATA